MQIYLFRSAAINVGSQVKCSLWKLSTQLICRAMATHFRRRRPEGEERWVRRMHCFPASDEARIYADVVIANDGEEIDE